MIGEERFHEISDQVLRYSQGDQTEILLLGEESNLTRFANSEIHQNVSLSNHLLIIRSAFGKKIGTSVTNRFEKEFLKRAVERSHEIAKLQPENPDFHSFPEPKGFQEIPIYFEKTHLYSPEERAEGVKRIVEEARKRGFRAFGAFTTGASEVAVANSLNLFSYAKGTDAFLNTILMADSGSGYAQSASRDVRKINVEEVTRSALLKAERSQNPVEVEPGEYEVVLEEYAVSTLLNFLGFMGL